MQNDEFGILSIQSFDNGKKDKKNAEFLVKYSTFVIGN